MKRTKRVANKVFTERRAISLVVVSFFLSAQLLLAQESPHGKIRFECSTCHTTDTWKMKRGGFNHEVTGFALTGQHKNVECATCHQDLKFAKSKSGDCLSCHTDIHKSELGVNCLRCHTMQTWKISDMVRKHQASRFPLLGKHASLDCQSCHTNAGQKQYAGTPTDCFSCHRNDVAGTKNPNHAVAGFSTNCVQCHKVTSFAWGTNFNHQSTAFALTGAHRATTCTNCHKNQIFKGTATQCASCHQVQFASTTNPNHPSARFSTDCQTCHTTATWQGARFDHGQTQFPLIGSHQTQECRACHGDNIFVGKPTDCVSCHRTQFIGTTNPNHVAGNFSTQCQTCHTQMTWQPATFNHATTRFPLNGTHVSTQCQQCHTAGNYQLVYTNCYSCHQTQYNQQTNPRHVLPSFAYDCTPCHSTTTYRPSTFNHSATNFQLVGAHQTVVCNQCHINNQYQNLAHTCWDCHATTFNATTNPNHQQGQFSHDCLTCHSQTSWSTSTFNHSTTRFPLTGVHRTVQCAQCHVSGNYQLVYTNCYPCHTARFSQPTNPNHVLGNFNHDCAPCHTTTVWRPSTFNHASTAFQLVGAHQTVPCAQCHVNNQFQNLPHTCWDCHATTFNATTNPNHQQGQFSHDCLTCHTQSAWQPATFTHATTNFPLTGAHVTTQCVRCHVNGNYQLQYTNCFPCHQTQYSQPTNPRHVLPSFAYNCTPCHNTTVWRPSTFSHTTTTFPLVGAHQAVTCNLCHVNNQYQLPHTCWDCHATDFNTTTNPSHQQGQFSHDCLTCHTQSAWQPASFNHASTNFPLTGAHITTTCVSCHVNGNYNLRYNDCYQCHAADFARPTNPNHVSLQLSHNCTTCHTTTVWRPSTFNHDTQFFKIYSGHHNGRWNNNCASCHPTIGQYQIFTCTTSCHTQSQMDNQHRNTPGYGYSSPLCYSCHRNT